MKKTTLLTIAFALAMVFVGCTNNDTPSTSKTKLWPAYNTSANLYGYINNKGEWAIPAQFSQASSFFSAGYAIVEINGNQAFINTDGEVQSCVSFDNADAFYYKYALASLNGKLGMLSTKFEFAIQPVYSYLSPMTADGLVTFQASADKFGFLDKKGNVFMKDGNPLFYEYASEFRDGYCVVSSNLSTENDRIPTYAVIDTKGNTVIGEGSYRRMVNMGLGIVATVDRNLEIGKTEWVLKKIDNNTTIGQLYDGVGRFSTDEVAIVVSEQDNNYKYGYINKDGQQVISLNYNDARISNEGYAWVLDDKTCKLIDIKGGNAVITLQAESNDVKEYPLCGVHNGLTLVVKATAHTDGTSYEFRWIDASANRTVFSWNFNKDKNNGMLEPNDWAPARKSAEEFSEYVFLK